ncbi:restriction endonuclease subunit S [Acinetobacter sp. NPDC052428]|uniref:restriction endonuclease subunit S n=1 Tax=Acinetobacter sp. NPDC052428 TaxID=3363890 RepID=UPI0037C61286
MQQSHSDGKSTPVYSACIPRIKNRINVHYYAYYLRNLALAGFIESLAKGIRERSTDFRFADFAELLLPFPKLEDQERIVAFLNQKTAEIDQAIAIKEQQIALLNERKQIVIQKAVTQGLDPNVLMKDSGVEWIGQIPEKWKLMRLKFLLSEINVRSETGDETLLSLSKYKGVIPKDALDERAGGASTLVGYKKVFKDNLVINKMQAVNGLLAVSELEGITSPDYSVYSAKDNSVSIHYITFLLNQPEYLAEMKKRVTGVMEGFIRLYTDDLFDIKVLLPSYAEQLKIVQYINTVIKQVEEATSNLVQQIEKLKEYKTTLINDAVTGKIKVA